MQQHILRGLLSGTPASSSSAPDRSHPITRTVLRASERPCLAHRLSAANCSILLVIASHRPTGRSHPRQGSSDDYALHYRTKTGARSEAHTTIGRALDRIGHRSPCLEGMKDASPRLDLSGPLVDQKLFFLQDDEYSINKREGYTLPFPFNQTTSTAINSFTQFAAILSPNQTLTASFHLAPHLLTYSGLDYFNPQSVTPDINVHESTGTIIHRLAIGDGLVQNTLAITHVSTGIDPQGNSAMILTPIGNQGNYFGKESRVATRIQWIENWRPRNLHF